MSNQVKDPKELSVEELQALLEEKQKEQKLLQKRKIKAFEQEKNDFVEVTVNSFKEVHKELKHLKYSTLDKASEMYKRLFELHEKEMPKNRKSFSLQNEDKTKKIVIDRPEKMAFTEEAYVAIEGIKEFFRKKFAERSKLVYSILDTIMSKNKEGDYDPRLLAKIRKEVREINDPELTKNFELLENSQVVVGIAQYVRAYEKDENGKWKDIVIQFSAL